MVGWKKIRVVAVFAMLAAGAGAAGGALLSRSESGPPEPYTFQQYDNGFTAVKLFGFECMPTSHALGEAEGVLCNRLSPFHPSYQVFFSSQSVNVFYARKGQPPKLVFAAKQP